MSQLAQKWRELEQRVADVEEVNARLEDAALTTARALGEVSGHWDAVYDAMRRADRLDKQISSERPRCGSGAWQRVSRPDIDVRVLTRFRGSGIATAMVEWAAAYVFTETDRHRLRGDED